MRIAHILVLASVASLVSTPASAATLSQSTGSDRYASYATLSFTAAPGEANRLTVSGRGRLDAPYASPSELVFHDDRAAVEAGPCRQEDRRTAVCKVVAGQAVGDSFEVSVELGDRSDVARVDDAASEAGVDLDGGEGNDSLTARLADAGPGDDVLFAKEGGSLLRGGAGSDRLVGGAGNDSLEGDSNTTGTTAELPPYSDVILGGAGEDTVNYFSDDPVVVDLAAGRARQLPADVVDSIADVESASTGGGDDVLIGTPGGNRLYASGGDDRLLGGRGDDVLQGGNGADRLKAGGGDDEIEARDDNRDADSIACGPGVDRLKTGDQNLEGFARDRFGPDCERLTYDYVEDVPPIPSGVPQGPRAEVPVHCTLEPCKATVTLRVDGRLVGQATRQVPFGLTERVVVALRRPAKGRELSVSTATRSGKVIERSGYRVRLR